MNAAIALVSASPVVATRHADAQALLACLALGSITFDVHAGTLDLVSHNGFEPCWSSALTVSGFLQSRYAEAEGREVCLPPAADGSSCATSQCTDGSPGCSVTLRGAQYSTEIIDTQAGYMRFNAATGFDPFSMPVVLPLVGACTLNFIDTTGVLVRYPLHSLLRPDGNSGFYVYDAQAPYIDVTGLSDDDVSFSGTFGCQLASFGVAFSIDLIRQQLGTQIALSDLAALRGESFCPLP